MIKPLWRVLVATGVFQLVGGAIDQYVKLEPDAHFTFYLGAMYATPFGFLAGVLWHRASGESLSSHIRPLAFLALISVVGPAIVYWGYGPIS
jgi:hypothetical protein